MKKRVELPEYTMHKQVKVEPEKTALVIVDMQNDFVRPEGKLSVPDAAKTVKNIQKLLTFARSHKISVFYTQDSHKPGDPEFAIWGEHVLEGTWGWEIIEELKPQKGELVFRKVRYDGFYGTALEHELRLRNIENVIVCGTVANICVHYTAASAALRWFKVILPVNAISALTEFDFYASIRQTEFLFKGIITTTNALRVAKKKAA